jgi:hypothetical protein
VQCVLLDDDVDPIVRRSFEAVDALALRRSATVLLCDGFAVRDREWPDVDVEAGRQRQRLARDVSGDRVGNVTRNRLSRARFTSDRWYNPI